ncbi:pyridoxal-dependent decarboxylase [Algivirga pacifica]|uniref:Pyridoxal-dependent decarboxylase n=1 Tax=Algivirga pacifica TaxID=1162670 RepID=A0ABP9DI20_9BACT
MKIQMTYWKKRSQDEVASEIKSALQNNVDFANTPSLGYPASRLDEKVFTNENLYLGNMPVLQAYMANPNHIGCHTFGTSEYASKGTQALEKELLNMVACDLFKMKEGDYDGYVSSGGTEANLQAVWMYRNYFLREKNANPSEIAIIASEDSHFSIAKAANLLMLDYIQIPVHTEERSVKASAFEALMNDALMSGKKYFIVISNMGTSMFGSVDNPDIYTNYMQERGLSFKLHIDADFGGFIYPFNELENHIDFNNPHISSIAVDAHEMLQAPFGTGIFICRKGLIENVLVNDKSYADGVDLTVCGSRSGANAVALWAILSTYGPHKWYEKISILLMRTDWFCKRLDELGIKYYRDPRMNIISIHAEYITKEIAERFQLVPQKKEINNTWYKVLIMSHVEMEHLKELLLSLEEQAMIS